MGLFAEGSVVKAVGEETFRICREVVDDVILVSTGEICAAIRDVFEDRTSILKSSGAILLAGLKKYIAENSAVDCGRQLVAAAKIGTRPTLNRTSVALKLPLGVMSKVIEVNSTAKVTEGPVTPVELLDTMLQNVRTEPLAIRWSSIFVCLERVK